MSYIRTDWTVLSMLDWATEYFEKKNVRNPRLSIEWILASVLEKKRLDLYLIFDRPLNVKELDIIRPLVKRRANHEPLQYITGETNFFGYPFKVKPGVLIPRSETEQLVELILTQHKSVKNINALDLGTGSGCIPISIKKERPHWKLSGIDISDEALLIAKQNAVLNEVPVSFWQDDLFKPSNRILDQQFDVIVSNPPYILTSEKHTLDEEVKAFEPDVALFTESTSGIYTAIKNIALKTLFPGGVLLLEINERFGDETLAIFESDKWNSRLLKDYSNKDRFILSKKRV